MLLGSGLSDGGGTRDRAQHAIRADLPQAHERGRRRDGEQGDGAIRYQSLCRVQPNFAAGDRVRAVLRVQPGHTRLPRYVRGHVGMVVAVHGAHVVPDENAQGRSIAEPLYTVAFGFVRAIFPSGQTPASKVHLDLWERYLERIEPT